MFRQPGRSHDAVGKSLANSCDPNIVQHYCPSDSQHHLFFATQFLKTLIVVLLLDCTQSSMQDEYFWLATGGGNNDVNAQYSLYDGHRYAIHNKIVQNMQREYGPEVRMMHTKAVVDAPYADRPTQEESNLLLETMSAQSNDWLRSVLMEVRRDHKALGRHPIQIRNDATLLDQILAYPMGEVYRVLKRQDVHFKRMIALYRQYGLPDDDEWSMIEQYTIPLYDDPSWASLMDRSLQFQDQLFGPNFLVKPARLNLSDRSQWIWVLDRRILFWMMMDGDQQLVDEIRTLRQSKYYEYAVT